MQVNLTSDKEYARIARAQKEKARELADRIKRGESLSGMDAIFAAAILRAWGEQHSEVQPRKKGHQHEVPYGAIASMVEGRVLHDVSRGKKRTKAQRIAEAAVLYGVSEKTVKEALRKDGPEARAILEDAYIVIEGS